MIMKIPTIAYNRRLKVNIKEIANRAVAAFEELE